MIQITAPSLSQQSLNINEASKACGLSPSVLRIWELRYGWPSPRRKANGYRAYHPHQVQELRRVADLVRAGMPISSLIVDGLPRWPADLLRPASPRRLQITRSLAPPQAQGDAALHRDLVDALEARKGALVCELLQRIFWSVRPADEPRTALVPALVALAEHRQAQRAFPESAQIAAMVRSRCQQLTRMARLTEEPIVVVAESADDQAAADLVVLILGLRGISARMSAERSEARPGTGVLWVGDGAPLAGARVLARLNILGGEGIMGLGEVLEGAADAVVRPAPVSA